MAMLAEPRQRKQYNLTPRGKALYEDDTRFGTKMLEKMGWSKGKGLGANEDGSKDFVRVRMRNTNQGLGFEDRNDHWTQHEKDFTGLLKTLNGDDEKSGKAVEDKESTSDEDTPRVGFGFAPEPKKLKVEKLKDKISGISLEQKSKLSKARVHYQKFTKGKDIAQYSEKDLANIFGKKVVETEQADGVYAQLTAEMPEEDNGNFAGVQTISTGLSVSDYFKQKMEALKNKQNQNNNSNSNRQTNAKIIEAQDNSHIKNKKKSKKRKREIESVEAEGQTTELISLQEVEDNTVLEVQEKKEKHKKNKRSTEQIPTETMENLAICKNDEKSAVEIVDLTDEAENEDVQVPKKKKKKKKEYKENEIEQHTNQNHAIDENKEVDILATEMPKKKKKSKKSKSEQSKEDDDVIIVGYEAPTSSEVPEHTSKSENPTEIGLDGYIKVKKNKKSKKRENSKENTEEASTPETSPDSKKSKKQKKSVEVLQESETAEQTTEKSKKSKKDVSEDNQTLTHDELIAKCNSYNIYNISSFVAEKFRNVDLEQFKGSTITHVPGYAHTADLQLNVVNEPHDEERITRLWNCSEDKYVQINPKAIFGRYRQNVLNAYKTMQHTKNREKNPLPLFNIKSLKRKSVFQPI